MESARQRVEAIRSEGYNLDFGTTFGHAFEVYKKIAVNAGLVFLMISMLFCIFGGMFFGVAVFSIASFSDHMSEMNPVNFTAAGVLIYFVSIVVISALLSPLTAGIIKMAYLADTRQHFSFETVFNYYKDGHFLKLVTLGVIISALGAAINLGSEFAGVPIIGAIISYIIAFFTVLAVPLVIFGNMNAIEAITASIVVVSKNAIIILGLLIVAALSALVGLIGFCIGIFFTLPIIYAMYYSIYVYTIGVVDQNELTNGEYDS